MCVCESCVCVEVCVFKFVKDMCVAKLRVKELCVQVCVKELCVCVACMKALCVEVCVCVSSSLCVKELRLNEFKRDVSVQGSV